MVLKSRGCCVLRHGRRILPSARRPRRPDRPCRDDGHPRAAGRLPPRETRRCALPGRLRRPADRPPADGHPAAHGQGRRLGAGALRRRLLQAAELDVAAVQGRARAPARTACAEWLVTGKDDDTLRILLEEVLHDTAHDLGVDPGLQKDGVEKHLQELLAEHPATLADGLTLVRREYPTAIGPVDLMCRDAAGPVGRGRDQAARRDRRRRAADPLPRAAQPRPAARARCAASSPPRRSSRRPGCWPPTAASPARSSTTTRCAAWTTPPSGCSDADLPPRHGRPTGTAAQRTGAYTTPRAAARWPGGLHPLLREDQWEAVRATFYADHDGPLVLLEIDTDLLTSPWRRTARSGTTTFPHVYGPIDLLRGGRRRPLTLTAGRPARRPRRRSPSDSVTPAPPWP